MKIFIEYDLNNESGKGKFIQRLTKEWDKIGVEYSDKPDGCDVRLAITRYRTDWKGKTVIRIDGAHAEFNANNAKDAKKETKKLAWKNSLTAKDIKHSDAVIWQSEFCKRMGHIVFGVKPKKEYVIFNGDNPENYKKIIKNDGKKRVVISARWKNRLHKRLKEMLEIANEYLKAHSDVLFHIIGENDVKYEKHPNIIMHGQIGKEDITRILCESDCMLNLAYFDWCPNAVVEALVAGVPVICCSGSGVAEIVKGSGIILDLDKPIPTDLCRACFPPKFEYVPVYNALDSILYGQKEFALPEHLYIGKIARQYLSVFEGVLND